MQYQNPRIAETAELLKKRITELENPSSILRSVELKSLFDELKTLPSEERANFGQQLNQLRQDLTQQIDGLRDEHIKLPPIDITAPYAPQTKIEDRPRLLPANSGSSHPLMNELQTILDIFYRMGFTAVESPEIDDDFHMFGSLNFPEGHPARDNFDTFMTTQTDSEGKQYIAPAHTSTMQHRLLKQYASNLEAGVPIAAVIPGRVFRNEDLDPRHEHTFYQFEGVYVDREIHVGHLIATIKTFLQEYYGKELDVMTQPFYFPFTEPSFEFAVSCPFCDKKGCNICSQTGWIELLGCGMIHPNVLAMAGIDTGIYTGFAWGVGIDRLVMMKYGIEDVRHFESGKLDFLRQFS